MDLREARNSIFLCGYGVADTQVEDMANRLSLKSRPNWNRASVCPAPPPFRTLALIANVDGSCLAPMAEGLYCSCFEISELGDEPNSRLLDWIAEGGAAYSLTTRTAYRIPVAYHICNDLAGHLGMSRRKREAIELALHEAIVNAAIHGNMAMGRAPGSSMEDIVEFYRMSGERVADPQYACRRVEILAQWREKSIELRVIDQGRGFSIEKRNGKMAPWKGLSLISSMADSVITDRGGNNLTMKFAR